MLVQVVPLPQARASHLVKGDELLPAVESSAFVYRAVHKQINGVRYEANKTTKMSLCPSNRPFSSLGYYLKVERQQEY